MIFQDMDRIVFAGDSVTDVERGRPVGEGTWGVGQGYVRTIDNMLAAYYPEIRVRVSNVGISGNTSRDLLLRWDNDVISLKPDWVSICIGINDVWRQFDSPSLPDGWIFPEEYRENLVKMITSIQGKVKGIFLVTPYYMEINTKDEMRARMQEYVDICRELAKEYGCILVDLQDMFDRYLTIRHTSFVAPDRVHPFPVGNMLIAREFLKKVDFDYQHCSY